MEAETRDRMQRAQALIKQQKYRSAYHLIQDIDHPTAIKWRNKLESLINDEFGDPFAETEAVPQSGSTVRGPDLADAIAIFLQNDWQMVSHILNSATVEKWPRSKRAEMALTIFLGPVGVLIALLRAKAQTERIMLTKKDDGTLRMSSKQGRVEVQNLHMLNQMAQSVSNGIPLLTILLYTWIGYPIWSFVLIAFLT